MEEPRKPLQTPLARKELKSDTAVLEATHLRSKIGYLGVEGLGV